MAKEKHHSIRDRENARNFRINPIYYWNEHTQQSKKTERIIVDKKQRLVRGETRRR